MTTIDSSEHKPPPPRSGFVTALATIFIALSGFSTFMMVVQDIIIAVVASNNHLQEAFAKALESQPLPAYEMFFIEHMYELLVLTMVISITTLVSSIGLLKRKNWARILFMAIMGLGIAWNFGGLLMQFFMFPGYPIPMPGNIPENVRANMEATMSVMMTVMTIFSAIIAIGLSILFGWFIKRLASPEIKREFS